MNSKIKVSIITPTFNSGSTISSNLESVFKQSYKNWELIIVDNLSQDQTLNIIKRYDKKKIRVFSGKDKGIYDAINKGIKNARGSIISILHSDDFYYNKSSLLNIVNAFNQSQVDVVYGNLIYVKERNINNILRFWKSRKFKKGDFNKGWSPAHPSFFVKKNIYKKLGNYRINMGNASDFELMYRFLEKNDVKNKYINKTLVTMRYGGSSNKTIYNILNQNLRIISVLNINFNILKLCNFLFSKLFERLSQFIKRPNKK